MDYQIPNGYGMAYPDPEEAHQDPYPGLSQPAFDDYPLLGPAIHEGFVPQQGFGQLDSSVSDYQRLGAEFHMRNGDPGQRPTFAFVDDTPVAYANDDGDSDSRSDDTMDVDDIFGAMNNVPLPADDEEQDPDYASPEDHQSDEEPSPDEEEEETDEPQRGRGKSRGRGRGRGSRGGRGRGGGRGVRRGRKGIVARMLKGTTHDPALNRSRNRLPLPRGENRGRGRVRGQKARKAVDPGPHFRESMAKAWQASHQGDINGTMENVLEAIKHNPEMSVAQNLLSNTLLKLGQPWNALGAAISGAVGSRDTNGLMMAGHTTMQLAKEYGRPTDKQYDQALWCYNKVVTLDRKHYAARVAKYELYRERGNDLRARAECKQMVKLRPYDLDNVRIYADLCMSLGESYEAVHAKEAYDRAFKHFYTTDRPIAGGDKDEQWGHLNVYFELFDTLKDTNPAEGIRDLKRYCRWFLGRKDETFWDDYQDDDREFDISHKRRLFVPEFQHGQASRDIEKYGDSVPTELLVRLGIFRMHLGQQHLDQAVQHFRQLLDRDPDASLHGDLYIVAAQALCNQGRPKDAIDFYKPLDQSGYVYKPHERVSAASCYEAVGIVDDAIRTLQQLLAVHPHYESGRRHLAKIYEDRGELAKSYEVLHTFFEKKKEQERKERERRIQKTAEARARDQETRRRRTEAAKRQRIEDKEAKQAQIVQKREEKEKERELRKLQPKQPPPPPGKVPRDPLASDLQAVPTRPGLPIESVLDFSNTQDNVEAAPSKAKQVRRQLRRAEPNATELRRIQDTDERIKANFEVVEELWPEVEDGGDEERIQTWLECASALYDDFTSTKHFYPSRWDEKIRRDVPRKEIEQENEVLKDMREMFKRLRGKELGADAMEGVEGNEEEEEYDADSITAENLPQEFYGISFDTWHRIFVDLAFLHARHADQEACYDILKVGLWRANVFYHNDKLRNLTQAASLHCALVFNDGEFVSTVTRYFMKEGDYQAGASFQLYSAAHLLCHGSNWFQSGPNQKLFLRAVKTTDYITMPPEYRKNYQFGAQIRQGTESRLAAIYDKEGMQPELDAGLLTIYGHIVGAANHKYSSIPYYYRALALQPDNIGINLAISTTFLQYSMKRQTENRQYDIAQALSFLYRYYDLRTASGKSVDRQEAEYNVARTWHQLGLTHLAVPAYERVLELSGAVQEEGEGRVGDEDGEVEDFATEAAYALQGIFALAGDDEAAARVTERWLVL